MIATAPKRHTIEEYLDFEYKSDIRHEYVNGKTIPMPYTTKNHGRIASNLNAELNHKLKGTALEAYAENRMLHVPQCQSFYYPDIMIVPIRVETFAHKRKMEADLLPVVLVEILSDSTEADDRDQKWKCYQQIPSLQQYILVSQSEMFVQVYTRQQNGASKWVYTSFQNASEKVPVNGCEIALEDIYHRVEFVKAKRKTDDSKK